MFCAIKPCKTCPFVADIGVTAASMAEHLRDAARADTYFQCHKAVRHKPASREAPRDWACAGYLDLVYEGDIPAPQLLRIAMRGRFVAFVDPNTGAEVRNVTVDPETGAPVSYPSPKTGKLVTIKRKASR